MTTVQQVIAQFLRALILLFRLITEQLEDWLQRLETPEETGESIQWINPPATEPVLRASTSAVETGKIDQLRRIVCTHCVSLAVCTDCPLPHCVNHTTTSCSKPGLREAAEQVRQPKKKKGFGG